MNPYYYNFQACTVHTKFKKIEDIIYIYIYGLVYFSFSRAFKRSSFSVDAVNQCVNTPLHRVCM